MQAETYSYIYSIPYIILFSLYFFLFIWENKLRRKDQDIKIIRLFSIAIFLIFFGCRGYLDTDFSLYYPLYDATPTLGEARGLMKFFSGINNDLVLKIEPGFKVFMVLLKTISSNYFFLQFVSSLIDVFFLDYFFRKFSPQYALSYILFLIFGGLILEFNLLRNSKSIILFIYSIQFIKDRKPLPFFLCNLLGLMFHSSAIFYFPTYFFLHKQFNKTFVWISFTIGIIIYLLQIKFILPVVTVLAKFLGGQYYMLAEAYSKSDYYANGYGITLGFIEKFGTFILFYLFYNRFVEKMKKPEERRTLDIFYNSFFIYSMFHLYLSEFSVFIDRMTILFIFSVWILYPYVYEILSVFFKSVFTVILLLFGTFKMYKSNNFITRKYENFLWSKPSFTGSNYILNKHIDKILNPPKK